MIPCRCKQLTLITLFILLAEFTMAQEQSPKTLVGTHIFEGANGFAIFSTTHLMWILDNRDTGNQARQGDLLASLQGEAVGGTYRLTATDRMILHITHALDPQMIDQTWEYEIEWLDEQRIRFWVLNPDGSQSERTGIAKKIN